MPGAPLNTAQKTAPRRVVIVGAGPRGTSVMERLLAQAAAARPAQGGATDDAAPWLRIDLIDPFEPGPGRVWRTSQSPLYLMNTPSSFPTIIPEQEVAAQPLVEHSFDTWRAEHHPQLASTDFPSRALYGSYLRWVVVRLLAKIPAGVEVHWHPAEAISVNETVNETASETMASETTVSEFAVRLDDGTVLPADAVVLALGHVPAALGVEQAAFHEAARHYGLHYQQPAIPAEIDWAQIPAGEPVLVRGMGLNFFDLLSQWTEGRGGRFVPAGGTTTDGTTTGATTSSGATPLRYVPSGSEPRVLAASRRGGPYRAKPEMPGYYPSTASPERLKAVLTEAYAQGRADLSFRRDLWPALEADAQEAYLRARREQRPREQRPQGTNPELFDSERLARPYAGQQFGSREEFDQAVLADLDDDVRGAAAGESDPVKLAIGVLNEGRALLKDCVLRGALAPESWLSELRGWFEPLVEGLASGPPAVRIAQLAALVRAGIVSFVGPDPVFQATAGGFEAWSRAVEGGAVRADWLVEAMSPANRVAQTASPLLRQLLDDGLVRPATHLLADGAEVAGSGLDVTDAPHRAVDAQGRAGQLYVLGLQLSSVQWGTAIAAQAQAEHPSGYQTLLDADRIAQAILESRQF
ncbi:FAD/NAD(P)-binding protein [Psychromicrobium xiongbiense]|uniref:FAD/NAD(P)-binding protein n=1 Tax=Psychromicrobium xiongbiense TaxID=3051184 RepID=UPI0025530029|nr:FAD/NAD(P)-binding protein [Psychromicrobium sp. YIM S02556]